MSPVSRIASSANSMRDLLCPVSLFVLFIKIELQKKSYSGIYNYFYRFGYHVIFNGGNGALLHGDDSESGRALHRRKHFHLFQEISPYIFPILL